MIKYKQPDPKSLIINGHTIEFQQRIATVIPLSDRVPVHLKSKDFAFGDKLVGRNLLAYDLNGKELWRVEDQGVTIGARREDTVTQPDESGRRRVPQSIFYIFYDEDDETITAALPIADLTIDPKDGKILDLEVRR